MPIVNLNVLFVCPLDHVQYHKCTCRLFGLKREGRLTLRANSCQGTAMQIKLGVVSPIFYLCPAFIVKFLASSTSLPLNIILKENSLDDTLIRNRNQCLCPLLASSQMSLIALFRIGILDNYNSEHDFKKQIVRMQKEKVNTCCCGTSYSLLCYDLRLVLTASESDQLCHVIRLLRISSKNYKFFIRLSMQAICSV